MSDNLNWLERLKFYTKDFTKEENIKLLRHVTWVKVEGLVKEQNEIEGLIEKHYDGKKSQ